MNCQVPLCYKATLQSNYQKHLKVWFALKIWLSITQNFMLFQTLGVTEKYATMHNAYKFKKLNLHYPNGALQYQYNQIGN